MINMPDEIWACPIDSKEKRCGAWNCTQENGDTKYIRADLVAPPTVEALPEGHEWDADGECCIKCGDKDWMAGPVCSGPAKPITNHGGNGVAPGIEQQKTAEPGDVQRAINYYNHVNDDKIQSLIKAARAHLTAISTQRMGVDQDTLNRMKEFFIIIETDYGWNLSHYLPAIKYCYEAALTKPETTAHDMEGLGKVRALLEGIAKRPDLPNTDRDADWKNCQQWSARDATEALSIIDRIMGQ